MGLVSAAGEPEEYADQVAATALRQGCLMILVGVDGPAPKATDVTIVLPDISDIAGWRALLAPVLAAPWAPYVDALCAAATDEISSALVAEAVKICRNHAADRERRAVAQEVRRLIADSGLTQRDFAIYIGTSASRLSTYATGRVMPSAAMLVRMRRVPRLVAAQPRDRGSDTLGGEPAAS